jgi:hypothetical protein
MANVVLLLAVLLAGASIVFSNSGMAALGNPNWISDACSNVPFLCHNPYQVGISAAVFGAFWVILKVVSAARG